MDDLGICHVMRSLHIILRTAMDLSGVCVTEGSSRDLWAVWLIQVPVMDLNCVQTTCVSAINLGILQTIWCCVIT